MSSNAEIRTILFDIAPEFYTVDNTAITRIDRFIDRSRLEISEIFFGDIFDLALAYLVAHRLKLVDLAGGAGSSTTGNGQRVSGGIITSEKLGDQSVNFANPSSGLKAGSYSSTFYGIEFERLRLNLFAPPFALG